MLNVYWIIYIIKGNTMECLPLGCHHSPAFAQMTSDILLGDADGSLLYGMGQSFCRLMFCAFKSFRNLLKINCSVFPFFFHIISYFYCSQLASGWKKRSFMLQMDSSVHNVLFSFPFIHESRKPTAF